MKKQIIPHLYLRSDSIDFILHGACDSYLQAIELGQQYAGRGNFYIDTQDRIPARSTQLGTSFPSEPYLNADAGSVRRDLTRKD